MNILYVTFEKPSTKSGGGLVVLQSLISLSEQDIYYVGPEFNVAEFTNIKLRETHFLETDTSIINRVRYYFSSIPHQYYASWRKTSDELVARVKFDLCHLEFSRYSDVVKYATQHGLRCNVRVHNIEFDYFKKIGDTKGFNKRKLFALLNQTAIRRNEQYVTKNANKLIFLTREDRIKSEEYYGNWNNGYVVPVCLLGRTSSSGTPFHFLNQYILMTGSYWYGPNVEGAIWFLDEVWNKIQDKLGDIGLVIAGARPNQDLKNTVEKNSSCVLIDSPEDISPYFSGASLYVAPIFDGAGMKVKVAEALSYGVALIGTKHALIGYEDAMDVCIRADTAEEFRSEILRLFKRPQNSQSHSTVRTVFEKNYSIAASKKAFEEIMII